MLSTFSKYNEGAYVLWEITWVKFAQMFTIYLGTALTSLHGSVKLHLID